MQDYSQKRRSRRKVDTKEEQDGKPPGFLRIIATCLSAQKWFLLSLSLIYFVIYVAASLYFDVEFGFLSEVNDEPDPVKQAYKEWYHDPETPVMETMDKPFPNDVSKDQLNMGFFIIAETLIKSIITYIEAFYAL